MKLSIEQQQLVEDNMALVHTVIKDRIFGVRSIGTFTYEDLFQIGCIGLCKAAYSDKFKYAYHRENAYSEENTHFSTYAYRLILNEILNGLAYATVRRAEISMDPEELSGLGIADHLNMDDEIADQEYHEALIAAMNKSALHASGTTAKGIQALVYSSQGYSSSEIASMMGAKSCHHVTAWMSKARKFLRSDPTILKVVQIA